MLKQHFSQILCRALLLRLGSFKVEIYLDLWIIISHLSLKHPCQAVNVNY